jgi:hypothetical protein
MQVSDSAECSDPPMASIIPDLFARSRGPSRCAMRSELKRLLVSIEAVAQVAAHQEGAETERIVGEQSFSVLP